MISLFKIAKFDKPLKGFGYYYLFTICATRSASVAILFPTYTVPFISHIPRRMGARQFHFQQHRISGHYHLLELAIINFQEISIILSFTAQIYSKHAAGLRQRFYL